jgi:hypothetical protein
LCVHNHFFYFFLKPFTIITRTCTSFKKMRTEIRTKQTIGKKSATPQKKTQATDECFSCGKKVKEYDNAKYVKCGVALHLDATSPVCDQFSNPIACTLGTRRQNHVHPAWHDKCALEAIATKRRDNAPRHSKGIQCPCSGCDGLLYPTTKTSSKSFGYNSSIVPSEHWNPQTSV